MAEKHGRELVDMLKESIAELKYYDQLSPQERKVDNYTLQTMYFNYSGNTIAVVLVRWESRHKEHGPATNYNLAVVNLGNAEINPSAIDDLVRQHAAWLPSLPNLRTSQYLVSDGELASEMYKRLKSNPPATAYELATGLSVRRMATAKYHHPNAASLFSPELRLKLG